MHIRFGEEKRESASYSTAHARGFLYLVAVMDWFSRYVLSWRLSTSLHADFCVDALEGALDCCGKPEIFNTDQGAQFTSEAFTTVLLDAEITISMDGKGRCMDNIFIERLWRSLKYEEVYLNAYDTVADAKAGIGSWISFYNVSRPHQALGYRTPTEIFAGSAGAVDMMDNASAARIAHSKQQHQQDSTLADQKTVRTNPTTSQAHNVMQAQPPAHRP